MQTAWVAQIHRVNRIVFTNCILIHYTAKHLFLGLEIIVYECAKHLLSSSYVTFFVFILKNWPQYTSSCKEGTEDFS